MTPPATRGRCRGGSIASSDCGDHIYQCAKFGACFQKCTNIVLSHWTIEDIYMKKGTEVFLVLLNIKFLIIFCVKNI